VFLQEKLGVIRRKICPLGLSMLSQVIFIISNLLTMTRTKRPKVFGYRRTASDFSLGEKERQRSSFHIPLRLLKRAERVKRVGSSLVTRLKSGAIPNIRKMPKNFCPITLRYQIQPNFGTMGLGWWFPPLRKGVGDLTG
jgi:hypothetical protein